MIPLIIRTKQIYDKFSSDEMTVYAAQASFFIIIAAFPFIMLMITVVQVVPNLTRAELLDILLSLVPEGYKSVAFRVLNDLSLNSPATMISVTAVTALWSSSRGMMSIARGLNRIHGESDERWYIVRRLIWAGYTIVFILVCVVALGLLVFGTSIQNFLVARVPVFPGGQGARAGRHHTAHYQFPHPAGPGPLYAGIRGHLHLCAGPEADLKIPDSGGGFRYGRVDSFFTGLFPVFPAFRKVQFFLYVRKPGGGGAPDAVALRLHLRPVFWG